MAIEVVLLLLCSFQPADRFYSPVTLSRKPLLFYPPVYPNNNRALNAVVSHINNPADFYIQLVLNIHI